MRVDPPSSGVRGTDRAQNKGEYRSVTCRITVDGIVISENTSSGEYGIATCKGSS